MCLIWWDGWCFDLWVNKQQLSLCSENRTQTWKCYNMYIKSDGMLETDEQLESISVVKRRLGVKPWSVCSNTVISTLTLNLKLAMRRKIDKETYNSCIITCCYRHNASHSSQKPDQVQSSTKLRRSEWFVHWCLLFIFFTVSFSLSECFGFNRRELWDSDLEGGAWDVFVSPFDSQNVVASLL